MTEREEGMYYLVGWRENPVLVQGYRSADANGAFGYGLNAFDGGHFIPCDSIPPGVQAIPVQLMTQEMLSNLKREATCSALGWAHADCRMQLDEGKDPRQERLPDMLHRAMDDLDLTD